MLSFLSLSTLDSTIHRINHYPADKYWGHWIEIYPVDSAIQPLNNRGLEVDQLFALA